MITTCTRRSTRYVYSNYDLVRNPGVLMRLVYHVQSRCNNKQRSRAPPRAVTMGNSCGSACGATRRIKTPDLENSVEVIQRSAERVETASGSNTLKRVNQYKMEDKLGQGAYGAVYRAFDERTGEVVAIKVMEKGELRKKMQGFSHVAGGKPGLSKPAAQGTGVSMSILKEIAVMKRVRHPNCVHLFEVIEDLVGDRIFLVMELLVGGEVMAKDNLPNGLAYLDEENARAVFRDLLDGLECTHHLVFRVHPTQLALSYLSLGPCPPREAATVHARRPTWQRHSAPGHQA